LHPLSQGGIGKVEVLGDGVDMVARDDLTDGLGAPKDAHRLGLFEYGLEGRHGMLGKVAFEGAHRWAP
jgi:hypothetical protein